MKFSRAALLPVLLASAAKVSTHMRSSLSETKEDPCAAINLVNRFPSTLPKEYTLVSDDGEGMAALAKIWDIQPLRDALKDDPEWKIGQPWILRANFSSDSMTDRTFGFPGGGGNGGFLLVKVPAGVQNVAIQVEDTINASAEHAEFQYRGPELWTSGQIKMFNICLAPRSCDNFLCPAKTMQKKGAGLFGYSQIRCCEYKMCKDQDNVCEPSTMYSKMVNFSTKKGYDNTTCCAPKLCPADLCKNSTEWTDKGDTGELGSTPEECCERQECANYTCSDLTLYSKKPIVKSDGSTRYGSTDAECCNPVYCNLYNCTPSDEYGLKADAANILGSDRATCCDVKKCDGIDCPNNTLWRPNPWAVVGSTLEQCCTPLYCSTWICTDNTTEKKANEHDRRGQSDEECCQKKLCSTYTCSDATRWVHRSDQHGLTNIDLAGYSDEECCDKVMCLPESCEPTTKWSPKPNVDEIQGNTHEQCCEKIFCDDFVCDTDVNGSGVGSQWYKRVDTNNFRWQGSTDEECCLPIYCSQYTTSHPTRWRRKKDPSAQGNSDRECYDELWCSDYCCERPLRLRPNPDKHQGSTDQECCVLDESWW